jgi:LCP family protein required for cell wall assembly
MSLEHLVKESLDTLSAEAGPPLDDIAGRSLRRHRRGRGRRRLLTASLAVIAVAGAIVVPKLLVDRAVPIGHLLGPTAVATRPIDGAVDLLVVGLDTRADNPALGSRADTIMIAHIPAGHDRAYLVSIPRDTAADLADGPGKINHAFWYGTQHGGGTAGGLRQLSAAVTALTGIRFDGALAVDFGGFTGIVDKLGGVSMYVDETTRSLHHGFVTGHPDQHAAPYVIHQDGTPGAPVPGVTPVVYRKGETHLTGYQALDFIRSGAWLPDGDYGRQRHEQQFLKALLRAAYDRKGSYLDLLTSLSKAFTFDPGAGRTISDWLGTLKAITPASIVLLRTNDGRFTPAPDGQREALSADTRELLRSVVTDHVDAFVAAHPGWVVAG